MAVPGNIMAAVEVSGSPSFSKIRDWLADYISGQKLSTGDRIPSERVLARSLGLSRPTIARALSRLVEAGVLTRGPGRSGTFVGGEMPRRSIARTRTIGMIMPCIHMAPSGGLEASLSPSRYVDRVPKENVSADIMHGVLSVVTEAGCRLIVHSNNSFSEEAEIMEHLAEEHLDGAVVLPQMYLIDRSRTGPTALDGPPFVFVDRHCPNTEVDSVVTDNLGSTKAAMASLIAKGHSRIGFFTDFADVTSVNDREAGYRAALDEAGIPVDESLICGPNNLRNMEWSFEYALYFCIKRADPITAAFGINDDAVWAILQAARTLGLSVPGDLEVAGFFDAHIYAGIQPSFLRVVQRKFEIGQIAARMLLERISGEAPPEARHIYVPADLMPGLQE